MKYKPTHWAPFLSWAGFVLVSLVICSGYGQTADFDKEVRVRDLPPLTAPSTQASDVLTTSLEIVLNNQEVCCGKNSALEDIVQSSDPRSLKDISEKLRGRHPLSDGRAITVTTEYLVPSRVTADHMIYMLREKHAPLVIWNSHLYVVEGVTYVAAPYRGGTSFFLHRFLLLDPRFSDSRREVSFNRAATEAGEVEGLLFLEVAQ